MVLSTVQRVDTTDLNKDYKETNNQHQDVFSKGHTAHMRWGNRDYR